MIALLLCACGDDAAGGPEDGSTGEDTTGGPDTSPTSSSTTPPTTSTTTTPSTTDETTTDETTTDETTSQTEGTTSVAECGNGVADGDEDCDGGDLAGEDCVSLGFGGGELGCDVTCTFDLLGCFAMSCGNDTLEGREPCDGANLDGQDCTDHGFDDGVLACDDGCAAFDLSGCFDYICGNDSIDGTDVCDGTDLAGQDCSDFDYTNGTLTCLDDCSDFDASGCFDGPPCAEENLGSAVGAAVASGSTVGEDEDLGQTCAAGGAVDRVFLWTAPADGLYTFDTEGSDYDTSLALHADCTGGPELACDDDGGSGLLSSLTRSMTAGETILVSVNGYDGDTGNYVLSINAFTGMGECCFDNGAASPGCDDATCTATVCAQFPSCCAATGTWDSSCASLALTECAACEGICGNMVADADTEVCDGPDLAGATCADVMDTFGTPTCASDCSAVNYDDCFDSDCCIADDLGGTGCDDATCQTDVCSIDAYCCDTAWDTICAREAEALCTACEGGVGDCCTEMGPGCADADCVLTICGVGGLDPTCCTDGWSAACNTLAQANCTVCM